MSRTAFKRAIVRNVITWDESATITPQSINMRSMQVQTLTAECGHTRVLRGFADPPGFIFCKRCEAGAASVPVVGPVGRIDKGDSGACGEFARALARRA